MRIVSEGPQAETKDVRRATARFDKDDAAAFGLMCSSLTGSVAALELPMSFCMARELSSRVLTFYRLNLLGFARCESRHQNGKYPELRWITAGTSAANRNLLGRRERQLSLFDGKDPTGCLQGGEDSGAPQDGQALHLRHRRLNYPAGISTAQQRGFRKVRHRSAGSTRPIRRAATALWHKYAAFQVLGLCSPRSAFQRTLPGTNEIIGRDNPARRAPPFFLASVLTCPAEEVWVVGKLMDCCKCLKPES